jgi:hypothetical protein
MRLRSGTRKNGETPRTAASVGTPKSDANEMDNETLTHSMYGCDSRSHI